MSITGLEMSALKRAAWRFGYKRWIPGAVNLSLRVPTIKTSSRRSPQGRGSNLIADVRRRFFLLLSGTDAAIFAAEIMHHHAVGIPGKRTARENNGMLYW